LCIYFIIFHLFFLFFFFSFFFQTVFKQRPDQTHISERALVVCFLIRCEKYIFHSFISYYYYYFLFCSVNYEMKQFIHLMHINVSFLHINRYLVTHSRSRPLSLYHSFLISFFFNFILFYTLRQYFTTDSVGNYCFIYTLYFFVFYFLKQMNTHYLIS
jgi:hypothetical protein